MFQKRWKSHAMHWIIGNLAEPAPQPSVPLYFVAVFWTGGRSGSCMRVAIASQPARQPASQLSRRNSSTEGWIGSLQPAGWLSPFWTEGSLAIASQPIAG